MNRMVLALFVLATVVCPGIMFGQKVKVDYDKSIHFGDFKTYAWAELNPAGMPLVRINIVDAIDAQLAAKGLVKAERNADLIVTYVGALAGETNQSVGAPTYPGYAGPPPSVNSTMWTGAGGGGGSVSYPKGTLVVELMDPKAGRITWRAVGKTKLDMTKKRESLARINDLIEKMFEGFPPQGKEK